MVASSPSHNLLPSYQWGSAEEGGGKLEGQGALQGLGPALEASSQVWGSMSHQALVLPAHPYLWLGGTDGAT